MSDTFGYTQLVVVHSPMGDRRTVDDKGATMKDMRDSVTQFLQRHNNHPPTWNYLAAIQTQIDKDSGHLFIGKSQTIMLPIDDVSPCLIRFSDRL